MTFRGRHRLERPVLVVCALILLGACTSPAPARYYRLDSLDLEPAVPAPNASVLAIGRISFPDYLQRPYMVRRNEGAEMDVDELSRWAEPLDEAVPRIVAFNVDALAPDVVVVMADRRTLNPDYRLFATVHRLDADARGNTELVVQWGITGAEGEATVSPRTTRYRATAAPADDQGAVAAAASDVLAQFSRDVVAALTRRP